MPIWRGRQPQQHAGCGRARQGRPPHLGQRHGVAQARFLVVWDVLQLHGHLAARRDASHHGILKCENALARVPKHWDANCAGSWDGICRERFGQQLFGRRRGCSEASKLGRADRSARGRAQVLCKAHKRCAHRGVHECSRPRDKMLVAAPTYPE